MSSVRPLRRLGLVADCAALAVAVSAATLIRSAHAEAHTSLAVAIHPHVLPASLSEREERSS